MSTDIIRRIADTNKLPPEWAEDLKVLKNLLERSAKINDPRPIPLTGELHNTSIKIATISLGPSVRDFELLQKSLDKGYRTVWVKDEALRRELREKFLTALLRAAKAGAKIICFNEMAYPKAIDAETDQELTEKIREIVHEHQLFVVAGSYHDCNTFHNVSPIFSASEEVAPHAKLSCATRLGERIRTPAGRVMRYYKTAFGKIGLLICLDAYEPTLFLRMMRQSSPWKNEEDIDLVLVPAFSPKNSQAVCDACQDLSYSTGAIVVYVNCPDVRPQHAVFVAGQKMSSISRTKDYRRQRLAKCIEMHTIGTNHFRALRNNVKDSYSPILRYILGDERVGFVEALKI